MWGVSESLVLKACMRVKQICTRRGAGQGQGRLLPYIWPCLEAAIVCVTGVLWQGSNMLVSQLCEH